MLHNLIKLFLGQNMALRQKKRVLKLTNPPAAIIPTLSSLGLQQYPPNKDKIPSLGNILESDPNAPLWIAPLGVDEVEVKYFISLFSFVTT